MIMVMAIITIFKTYKCCRPGIVGYSWIPFACSWSTMRSTNVSELTSSISALRSLSRPLLLLLDDTKGKSWDCRLASEGSVRGVDLEAALQAYFGYLDTSCCAEVQMQDDIVRGSDLQTVLTQFCVPCCQYGNSLSHLKASHFDKEAKRRVLWVILPSYPSGIAFPRVSVLSICV